MTQTSLTFDDLVQRYGKLLATEFLQTLERLAKPQSNVVAINEDARLHDALAHMGGVVKTVAVCPLCGGERQALIDTVQEAVAALELCLECDGLTWEAEQEANALCNRIRRNMAR